MPAKDLYHSIVINALEKEGWLITDDPLWLKIGSDNLYVDLGAERSAIGAERNGLKIAIEIKSFLSRSGIQDLQEAVGQFELYNWILTDKQPERTLYLAIPMRAYLGIFATKIGRLAIERTPLKLIIFDELTSQKWIS